MNETPDTKSRLIGFAGKTALLSFINVLAGLCVFVTSESSGGNLPYGIATAFVAIFVFPPVACTISLYFKQQNI